MRWVCPPWGSVAETWRFRKSRQVATASSSGGGTKALTAAARPKGWLWGALALPHTHTSPGLLGGGKGWKEGKEKREKEGGKGKRAQLAGARVYPQLRGHFLSEIGRAHV